MYVPAANVGEAIACVVNRGRAGRIVSVIDRELSRDNGDQAGPRMCVPPTMRPDWPRVPDDIDIRIPLHSSLEVPPILVKLVAHQVEQAIWKRAHRQIFTDNPA